MAKKTNFEKMTIRQKINFVNKNDNLANIPFHVLIDVVEYDMMRIQKNSQVYNLENLWAKMRRGMIEMEDVMNIMSKGCSKMGFYLSEFYIFDAVDSVSEYIMDVNFPETDDDFFNDNDEVINNILNGATDEARELIITKEIKEYCNNHFYYIIRFKNAEDAINYIPYIQNLLEKYMCKKAMDILKAELNKVFEQRKVA